MLGSLVFKICWKKAHFYCVSFQPYTTAISFVENRTSSPPPVVCSGLYHDSSGCQAVHFSRDLIACLISTAVCFSGSSREPEQNLPHQLVRRRYQPVCAQLLPNLTFPPRHGDKAPTTFTTTVRLLPSTRGRKLSRAQWGRLIRLTVFDEITKRNDVTKWRNHWVIIRVRYSGSYAIFYISQPLELDIERYQALI